jgi:hypothetical protein
MSFTSTTTTHLARHNKSIAYTLELRTGFPESAEWQAVPLEDFSLTCEAGLPAVLRAEVINAPPGMGGEPPPPLTTSYLRYSDERDPANPLQLGATARLVCTVGGGPPPPLVDPEEWPEPESEVLFYGRVFSLTPREGRVSLVAHDMLALLAEVECDVSFAPDETDELDVRELSLVADGALGSVWGYTYLGSGDDAFNQDDNPGTRRRSWAPGDIRLWYDADVLRASSRTRPGASTSPAACAAISRAASTGPTCSTLS